MNTIEVFSIVDILADILVKTAPNWTEFKVLRLVNKAFYGAFRRALIAPNKAALHWLNAPHSDPIEAQLENKAMAIYIARAHHLVDWEALVPTSINHIGPTSASKWYGPGPSNLTRIISECVHSMAYSTPQIRRIIEYMVATGKWKGALTFLHGLKRKYSQGFWADYLEDLLAPMWPRLCNEWLFRFDILKLLHSEEKTGINLKSLMMAILNIKDINNWPPRRLSGILLAFERDDPGAIIWIINEAQDVAPIADVLKAYPYTYRALIGRLLADEKALSRLLTEDIEPPS